MRTLFIALEGFTCPAFRRASERGALPSLDVAIVGGGLAELHFPMADMRLAMLVSAMTGSWPDQHGILTAEKGDPASLMLRRVTGADRARPALWELLDADGVRCLSVGWPVAITDRITKGNGSGSGNSAIVSSEFGRGHGALHPELLAESLAGCMLRPEELDPAAIANLMPGWAGVDPSLDSRPGLIGTLLAENVTRHAAFLELMESKEWGEWGFATLCLSLEGELASLERASRSMGDGLLEGLSDRGLPLMDAFLGAILGKIPAGTNLLLAGIPHAETPEEGGFLLVSGPSFDPQALPRSVGIPEIAPLVLGACGFRSVGMPTARLAPVLRKEQPQQDSIAERESKAHGAPEFRTLLAVESPLSGEPGQQPLPWELWHVHALSVLSRSLMARGEAASALPVLEAQARLLPMNQKAHLLLSECQGKMGLLEEALDSAYAAIHPIYGNNPVALLRAAELEALAGRPERARDLLKQAAPEMGGFPQHRLLQANVLILLRDWPEAEALLGVLAKESPWDAYVRYRLSRCHVARGIWQEAFDHAVESVRIDPSRAAVHELLGYALHGMGMLEQSRTAFENATVIAPHWPRPKAMLVVMARRMKRPQEEIESLSEAYRISKKAALPNPRPILS